MKILVFSLPMRNWNAPAAGFLAARSVFSAYLWGIETFKCPACGGNQYTFSAYLWGIETFSKTVALAPIVRRFQPTYEELKLLVSSIFLLFRDVFSLPMRNWNVYAGKIAHAGKIVFSLPMRNWNKALQFLFRNRSAVFSLPMRNWNGHVGLIKT